MLITSRTRQPFMLTQQSWADALLLRKMSPVLIHSLADRSVGSSKFLSPNSHWSIALTSGVHVATVGPSLFSKLVSTAMLISDWPVAIGFICRDVGVTHRYCDSMVTVATYQLRTIATMKWCCVAIVPLCSSVGLLVSSRWTFVDFLLWVFGFKDCFIWILEDRKVSSIFWRNSSMRSNIMLNSL
jgi:hypothetical protein